VTIASWNPGLQKYGVKLKIVAPSRRPMQTELINFSTFFSFETGNGKDDIFGDYDMLFVFIDLKNVGLEPQIVA
jgi:hypothetical protein